MNRRQKMKKMKQELEWYKSQCVPVREVCRGHRVNTLVNVSYYHMHDYNGRCLHDIYREVGATLSHLIAEEYIEFDEEMVDIGGCPMMQVTAKLRVAIPYGGDRK